jgi:nitrogen regulatory protein PII
MTTFKQDVEFNEKCEIIVNFTDQTVDAVLKAIIFYL